MLFPTSSQWAERALASDRHRFFYLIWDEIFHPRTQDTWQVRTTGIRAILDEIIETVEVTTNHHAGYIHHLDHVVKEALLGVPPIHAVGGSLPSHCEAGLLAAQHRPQGHRRAVVEEPERNARRVGVTSGLFAQALAAILLVSTLGCPTPVSAPCRRSVCAPCPRLSPPPLTMSREAVKRLVGHQIDYLVKVKALDKRALWIAVGRAGQTTGLPPMMVPVEVTAFWPRTKKIAGILKGQLMANQALLRLVYIPGDGKQGALQITTVRHQEITRFHWRIAEQIVYSRSTRLPRPLELMTDAERKSAQPHADPSRDVTVGYLRLRRRKPDTVKHITSYLRFAPVIPNHVLSLNPKTLAPVFARSPRKGPGFLGAQLSTEPIVDPHEVHTAIRFGSFTRRGRAEIVLQAQMDAGWNWRNMVWLLRFEGGRWRILQRLAVGGLCFFDTVDVDGDGRWEVLTECAAGGQGIWGSGAELVRLSDSGKTVLYRNRSISTSGGFGCQSGLADIIHRVGFGRPLGKGPLLLYQHTVKTYQSYKGRACFTRQPLVQEMKALRVLQLVKGKYQLVELPKGRP